MTWLTVMEYLCQNDHEYVPLVVSTSRSLYHTRLIIGFVTRVTRRVPLMEQELLSLSLHPRFGGVRSLVLCVVFGSLFVRLSFLFWSLCFLSFYLRILISPLVSLSSPSFLTDPHFQFLVLGQVMTRI